MPDDEAQLQEENIRIRANNDKGAQEKCEQESEAYNRIDATAYPTVKAKEYDCKFKFWA